jgi:N-carbamoyl-L-amino-acid hydrolase
LGTVGLLEHFPNVINVVPDRVRLVTDLRNPDYNRLRSAQMQLDDFVERESTRAGITVQRTEKVRLAPVDFSQEVVDIVDVAAKRLGLTTRRMVSGAGHDAQMMAAISKAAMIFVPSANGISHNEKEFTSPEDLSNGANVLLEAVMRIAG